MEVGLAHVVASASLPFPIRVSSTPYEVRDGPRLWALTVERVARVHPDERLFESASNVDLRVDRLGQVAFSRIVGETHIAEDSSFLLTQKDVLAGFRRAANVFIAHARDTLGTYWIRPVEANELYAPTVVVDGDGIATYTMGPGGSIIPMQTLTDGADKRLREALAGKPPPLWRQMQLDARDALELGREEDCVVLSWSSLETACRQALPGLAYKRGKSVAELAETIGMRYRKADPPYSYEEALSRVSSGMTIVRAAAELTDPVIYVPQAVFTSVEIVYKLRNKVVHQGVQLLRHDAEAAWNAVEFVLQTALSLRNDDERPLTESWAQRFETVDAKVEEFAQRTGLRLVLTHPPRDEFFDAELIGDSMYLAFSPLTSAESAYVLMNAQWQTWQRLGMASRPRLAEGPPSGILLEGGITYVVAKVNSAVCYAETLIAMLRADPSIAPAFEAIAEATVAQLGHHGPFDHNDARIYTNAAHLAALLAVLPESMARRFLDRIDMGDSTIGRLAGKWRGGFALLDPDDDHSRCDVLREIHDDAWWFDTIRVICPVEKVAYGSGRHPLT